MTNRNMNRMGTEIDTYFITAVLPVRNEVEFIRNTLLQLLQQDYPADRFEIVVVDGMSDDGTCEVIKEISRKHHNIRLMTNERRLSSSGRNVGFKNGKGDIFLVVDGHCHIENDQLFKNIMTCLEKSGADCLGRPQPLDPPGLTSFQQAVALARASIIGHGRDSLIYSGYEGYASPVSNGAVYKRDVFQKVGYVDEDFDACEDVEFNYRIERAGLKAYTSPLLTVKYYPRETLKGLFKQMVRYGVGRFRLVKKHSDTFSVSLLIPPVFTTGLFLSIGSALLYLISGLQFAAMILSLLLVIYGIYAIVVLIESLRIAIKNGLRYFAYLPAIFFIIHFGLGWGYMKRKA